MAHLLDGVWPSQHHRVFQRCVAVLASILLFDQGCFDLLYGIATVQGGRVHVCPLFPSNSIAAASSIVFFFGTWISN